MTTVETPWPRISDDPVVQEHYEACRSNGTAHVLAEMFALGSAPTIKTDATFLRGHCNGSQFAGQDEVGNAYRQAAEAEGQNVKGKVYLSQLAAYPGDPRAWVSGRGDVQKVCEERGWGCDGAVKTKMAHVAEPAGGRLDESLVKDEVAAILAETPDAGRVDVEDLTDQVRQKRKPHWEK